MKRAVVGRLFVGTCMVLGAEEGGLAPFEAVGHTLHPGIVSWLSSTFLFFIKTVMRWSRWEVLHNDISKIFFSFVF